MSTGDAHGGLPGEVPGVAPATISAPGADLSLPLHGSDMEMMEQISNDLVSVCAATRFSQFSFCMSPGNATHMAKFHIWSCRGSTALQTRTCSPPAWRTSWRGLAGLPGQPGRLPTRSCRRASRWESWEACVPPSLATICCWGQ